MAQLNNKELTTLPVGRLGLIPLDSCRPLGEKVNEWLVKWRKERENPELGTCAFEGYQRDSYIINVKTPRFGSGEGKGEISESVRGDDIYVMVDVCNHSINYTISGYTNMMSPDDHEVIIVNMKTFYIIEESLDELIGRLDSFKTMQWSCVLYT